MCLPSLRSGLAQRWLPAAPAPATTTAAVPIERRHPAEPQRLPSTTSSSYRPPTSHHAPLPAMPAHGHVISSLTPRADIEQERLQHRPTDLAQRSRVQRWRPSRNFQHTPTGFTPAALPPSTSIHAPLEEATWCSSTAIAWQLPIARAASLLRRPKRNCPSFRRSHRGAHQRTGGASAVLRRLTGRPALVNMHHSCARNYDCARSTVRPRHHHQRLPRVRGQLRTWRSDDNAALTHGPQLLLLRSCDLHRNTSSYSAIPALPQHQRERDSASTTPSITSPPTTQALGLAGRPRPAGA